MSFRNMSSSRAPITFGMAYQNDVDHFGRGGPYWKKAFGSPELGAVITVEGHSYVVTFSGVYTIDCEKNDCDFQQSGIA